MVLGDDHNCNRLLDVWINRKVALKGPLCHHHGSLVCLALFGWSALLVVVLDDGSDHVSMLGELGKWQIRIEASMIMK